MKISEMVLKIRKEHNLTQAEMAKQLFVSRQAVYLWEKDKSTPSIETLKLMKEKYNISIDEFILSSSNRATLNDKTKMKKIISTCLIIFSILAVCSFIVFEVIHLSKMYDVLNPQHCESNSISRMGNIYINENYGSDLVFEEDNKPSIICSLPTQFNKVSDRLYADEDGNFIRFNSDYDSNVINPLSGTDYFQYYEEAGFSTYSDMARKAMYVSLKNASIFSKENEIYIVGGAKILRQWLCAGNDAKYYEIDGGLTQDKSKMRIYGFALLMDGNTWIITLKDYNDYYYYISIHDEKIIKNSEVEVGKILSSIVLSN